MRFVVLAMLLAGCPATLKLDGAPGDGALVPAECMSDFDCVAAGAKCCDCPTFAEPKSDPAFQACKGVACPSPTMCPNNVRPSCNAGKCELACVASACDQSCADGYAVDAAGCLTCACAVVDTHECAVAADCARVRADCCGCARGGNDTAVAVGAVAGHDASLMCPASPSCPDVDTCVPDLAPACVQGACQLISGGFPIGACGRPDLMDCPASLVCTINADAGATAQGLGVCRPPE